MRGTYVDRVELTLARSLFISVYEAWASPYGTDHRSVDLSDPNGDIVTTVREHVVPHFMPRVDIAFRKAIRR